MALLINKNTYICFRFCNITEELFNKGLCSWPQRTAPWTSRGPRSPI